MTSETGPKRNEMDIDQKDKVASNMEEDAAPSPASQQDDKTSSGQKATKDRACPFCGQSFTSSSLGRHLDLYIKPKNPKPPDGVHDVVEIRRLRAGITRRQPRMSGRHDVRESLEPTWHRNAREDSAPDSIEVRRTTKRSANESPAQHHSSPSDSPVTSKAAVAHVPSQFQIASWQATGVINDIPPRISNDKFSTTSTPHTQHSRSNDSRRDGKGSRMETIAYDKDGMTKLQEQAEVGRAAEMALREVLGSLQAARQRTEPVELFPGVDFMALSFPALCLVILPSPTTLFTSQPFPSLDSWALEPPGQDEYNNVTRLFKARLQKLSTLDKDMFASSDGFRHSAHLNSAYDQWKATSEQERDRMWKLELARSFYRSQEQKSVLETRLEEAENRIRHLETEYDRLSRCQLPRDFLTQLPRTTPITAPIMRELRATRPTEVAAMDYDADALLLKWRDAFRRTGRKSLVKYSAYTIDPDAHRNTHHKIERDIVSNGAMFGINGAFPRDDRTLDNSGVDYETPRTYGAVIGEEEEEPRIRTLVTSHPAQNSPPNDARELSRGGVLSRLMPGLEPANRTNANGKRPLGDRAQA